ncbi:hypothetical protein L596_000967 [Steinernema carpocapsae]|uniref:Uncharacterized protein n=1 Tax=Steinernema carpocapsae TaxID=34508 RepID=A0A4U8UJM7_STECR|nr:hypothetical protein L596_000967 [Steinernema carpocapsae]
MSNLLLLQDDFFECQICREKWHRELRSNAMKHVLEHQKQALLNKAKVRFQPNASRPMSTNGCGMKSRGPVEGTNALEFDKMGLAVSEAECPKQVNSVNAVIDTDFVRSAPGNYNLLMKAVRAVLDNTESFVISVEGCAVLPNANTVIVVAAYYEDRHIVLAAFPSSGPASEDLVTFLLNKCFKNFDFPTEKVSLITHDMKASIELLLPKKCEPTFGHILNDAVKKGLETFTDIENIFKRLKSIVKEGFKASSEKRQPIGSCKDLIKDLLKETGCWIERYRLLADVFLRDDEFNFYFERNPRSLQISPTLWNTIEKVVLYLRPLFNIVEAEIAKFKGPITIIEGISIMKTLEKKLQEGQKSDFMEANHAFLLDLKMRLRPSLTSKKLLKPNLCTTKHPVISSVLFSSVAGLSISELKKVVSSEMLGKVLLVHANSSWLSSLKSVATSS